MLIVRCAGNFSKQVRSAHVRAELKSSIGLGVFRGPCAFALFGQCMQQTSKQSIRALSAALLGSSALHSTLRKTFRWQREMHLP